MNLSQLVSRTLQQHVTLLGIGPMSKAVLQAGFELAKEQDFPLMLIASRNQVDSAAFGYGYVGGWDQAAFGAACGEMAQQVGFDGLYYLCRDHGGPWQRDEERAAALPEEEAMDRALRSFIADLHAGFGLLHVDPTKDPHVLGQYRTSSIPMDVVLQRTVALIDGIEQERRRAGLPEVAYEVGTEETSGGLTSPEAFGDFVRQLCETLDRKGLPRPSFIVGQTGTLVRLTENVGRFSQENAGDLAAIARENGVGLKEHNTDYIPDADLLLHPALRVTAANVAPEFGVVETRACKVLCAIAREMGGTEDMLRIWQRAAVDSNRWRKWMTQDITPEQLQNDEQLADQVLDIAGHYCFDQPDVQAARVEMTAFLEEHGVPAQRYVVESVKASIARYVRAFGLAGWTARVRGV